MTNALTPLEHQRISDAIRAAERRTAGEIYCVVAKSSGRYFASAAVSVLIAIMIASAIVALALHYLWIEPNLTVFVSAQLASVACALAILRFSPAIAMRFVPISLSYRRAHENAVSQFLAHNVHRTAERTGVLLFVSLRERYATVIADGGIDSHVAQETWNGIVAELIDAARADRLADGFVAAIGTVGALLATHVPQRSGDVNELPDHLVEI